MQVLELARVSARYPTPPGGRRSEPLETQLREVDFSLRAGELCVVLGCNGSGKSTLIRVMAGTLDACAGNMRLLGRPSEALSRQERARAVALVTQRSEATEAFTVGQVVEMGRAPHQGRWMRASPGDRQAVAAAIEACDLQALLERPVGALSGGEQQRVHVARAFAQAAPILLLDEAAAHLDIRHRQQLYRLVRERVMTRDLACVAAMHDLSTAAHYADRVLLLKAGRVLACGPPADVMTESLLGEAFGVALERIQLDAGRLVFVAREPPSPIAS